MPNNIVITGASSGLGAALAMEYAAPGRVLGLIARRAELLAEVAERCAQLGAKTVIGRLDVRHEEAVEQWIGQFHAAHPVDLLIANAGVFSGHGRERRMEPTAAALKQIRINLEGGVITVSAVLPHMRRRASGHIAIIASLAGLQPLADAPAYSASKAGLIAYGEGLREYLAAEQIRVSLVCPGHIATAQTTGHIGPLPLEMSPERAAQLIRRGLDQGRTWIAFPRSLKWLIRVGRLLPWRLRAIANKPLRFEVEDSDG